MALRILGVITARGGSKGIPRKNIRHLGGKPLLQYTAEAALNASSLTRVILSTDDLEIAEVGRKCGLDVPFIRSAELARDDTPTLPVVQHAVHFVEQNDQLYDAICLLQPTNPFRTSDIIEGCIRLFQKKEADSVFTILSVPHEHNPHWVYLKHDDDSLVLSTGEHEPIPRRQLLPPAFHREGSVYLTRREVLINEGSLYGQKSYGYCIDGKITINLDTLDDWSKAEQVLKGLPS